MPPCAQSYGTPLSIVAGQYLSRPPATPMDESYLHGVEVGGLLLHIAPCLMPAPVGGGGVAVLCCLSDSA